MELIEFNIEICQNHIESEITLCPNCHIDWDDDPWMDAPLTDQEKKMFELADITEGSPF